MKKILVVGASSGIGEATCRYLHEQGYFVVMVARNEEKLIQLRDELQDRCMYYPFDITNVSDILNIFEHCVKEQKFDGLVYCAGINRDVPVKMNDVDDMMQVMATNYYGFVELAKYYYKKKYSNEGSSIVAISSISAKYPDQGMCVYSSSKAAMNNAVAVMAKEFAKRKFKVNSIMPGYVETPFLDNLRKQGNLDEVSSYQPFGLIPPVDVAYYIEFLLSEKNNYITGAALPITGGL